MINKILKSLLSSVLKIILAIIIILLLLGLLFLTQETAQAYAPELEVDFITPELKAICGCESMGNWKNPQHFNKGKIIIGRTTPDDKGICQINKRYWGAKAKELGFNILERNGNIQMANWIYERQGTQPWSASKGCWNR